MGLGYVRLARDEFAWARYAFHEALALEPTSEDALAGMGEALLKFGRRLEAFRCFDEIMALGFREDHDIMLQVGRALFREGEFDRARNHFELALLAQPDSAEAAACLGYSVHRLGDDDVAIRWLTRALEQDSGDAETQIYLGNVLYDNGDYDGALHRFEQTHPVDHIEELALWRYIELKKSMYKIDAKDPTLRPWVSRLWDLTVVDQDDVLLSEIESTLPDGTFLDPRQLDFFGAHVGQPAAMLQRRSVEAHDVILTSGLTYSGSWEQIVFQMLRDDEEWPGGSVADYMVQVARRSLAQTGVAVPQTDAESFIKGVAEAGLLRITT